MGGRACAGEARKAAWACPDEAPKETGRACRPEVRKKPQRICRADGEPQRACRAEAPKERRREQGRRRVRRTGGNASAGAWRGRSHQRPHGGRSPRRHTRNRTGRTGRIRRTWTRKRVDTLESERVEPAAKARSAARHRGRHPAWVGCRRDDPRRHAARKSRSRSVKGASNNSRRGMTTTSTAVEDTSRCLKSSRISRLALFLRTASPIFREATIPSRVDGDSPAASTSVK